MDISVKLFASLRTGRFDIKNIEIPDNNSVGMICRKIGIPDDLQLIIFVNSRHVDLDYMLSDGDTLAIFPLLGGG